MKKDQEIYIRTPRTWFRDLLPILLICLLGFIATSIAHEKVTRWQRQILQSNFSSLADSRITLLRTEIQSNLTMLYALQSLFASSQQVEYPEFDTFTERLLKLHPHIQAFKWIPRILPEEKSAFEAKARQEIAPDYRILEKNIEGNMIPATNRKEYFPIYYVSPRGRNHWGLGYNCSSNLELLQKIEKTRDSKTIIATRIFNFAAPGNPSRYGLIVFLPVYKNELPQETLAQRRSNLTGVVAMTIDVRALVKNVFVSSDFSGLEMDFFAENTAVENVLLYRHSVFASQARDLGSFRPEFIHRDSLYIADQLWLIIARNTHQFHQKIPFWEANAILISGILMTLFFALLVHDATHRKKIEIFRLMSLHDELTGLYNRRGFSILLEEQLKLSKRKKMDYLLVYLDLDGFKKINDTYGHKEGDTALLAVSQILQESFRTSDILARVGGDEFAIFALEAKPGDENILLRRLELHLQQYNEQKLHPYTLSWSIGTISHNSQEEHSFEDLLAEADQIMYRRKKIHHESSRS